jgi:hypothetical protein
MTRHRARKRKPWVRPPWALRAGTAPLGG